jgi:multicomponent Na+:H+ antiporter subunit E
MRHSIGLALVLVVFWLIISGHYTALILSLGAASVALVVYISHRMDVVDHEAQPLHLTLRLPAYWAWLLKEIVLSNFDVVYRIWRGNSTLSPTRIVVRAGQRTAIGRVIYANSITLTPGTVSMDLQDGDITVHALTRKTAESLQSGEMDRRVRRLED